MTCQAVKPISKVFKSLAARYSDSDNYEDMNLYLSISKDRGTQDMDDVWRICQILVWHRCYSFSLASRAPEASPSSLGRLDGSEAQMCRKF